MLKYFLLCGLFLQSFSYAASEEALFVPQAEVPTPGPNLKQTANFDDLRHNVLDLISSSKKRVWLLTDYLTDGDIVSALFLAKYRKVDVKVFLGQGRLNSYLSRLNYLKAQNIPVFTRPEHGFIAPTIIFVDQRLFTVNRDLNVLVRHGSAQIAQASPSDVAKFVNWFRGVADLPIPAEAKPLPIVGRAGGNRSNRSWGAPAVSSYQGETSGAYNYDRSNIPRQAPEGVSTKLPRILRWQKAKEQQRESVPAKTQSIDSSLGDENTLSVQPSKQPKFIEPGPQSPFEAIDPSRPRLDEESISPPSEER